MKVLLQSLLQLIISAGYIRDDDAKSQYVTLCTHFGEDPKVPIVDIFKEINNNIKLYGFEIKTVIIRNPNNIRIQYHSFTNTSTDFVAEKYGSKLNDKEISFFRDVITALVEESYLSSADISKYCRGWKNEQMLQTLEILKLQGW